MTDFLHDMQRACAVNAYYSFTPKAYLFFRPGEGFLYNFQGTARAHDYMSEGGSIPAQGLVLSFDCKGQGHLRGMYGACGACLSGLSFSSFAIVSAVLVCPACRGEGPRLPAVCPHQRGTVTVYTNREKRTYFFE